MCAKCKKQHISLYPANERHRPVLGQRWASVVDGGTAPAQHRDNVSCLLGIHDILPISKKLNKVMIISQQYNNNKTQSKLTLLTILLLNIYGWVVDRSCYRHEYVEGLRSTISH